MSASNVDRIESAANITLNISKGGEQVTEGDFEDTDFEETDGFDDAAGAVDAGTLRVPISQLDTTKDIEISEIRESSLKATGYSVTSISYSGSMMFKGERVHGPDNEPTSIESLIYDSQGVPVPCSITITHELSGKTETFEDVLVTSDSYEVQAESETETAFDWIAMDKTSKDPETDSESS
ncbi:tail tube [Haloarcula virus HCTV-8]|uniref:Tail tube n=3 Tax=Haloferacalesvirus hv5 TaxID=1273753 RepID=A0AAE8XUE3_9CAUD|nr:tail tube [Haloarcula phage HCTV-7]UBF20461.1 tail tube [Haloarcula phage HCTV-9]UBF20577.1 tail tube [Haloarcula phage HCTV-11]UBF20693.1 tail tube [Halorubrum virus HRTV-9]UBF20806.1 tail tube [Halorubrum virus HRTV-16]UBF20919.1 tail tube [Haloarcula virus HCTV-8]UBF21031.1 tail tube [Haloarcula virus HCTV-10]